MVEIFREINIQMLNSRTLHAGLELEWGETSIDTKSTTANPSAAISASPAVPQAQASYPTVTSTPKPTNLASSSSSSTHQPTLAEPESSHISSSIQSHPTLISPSNSGNTTVPLAAGTADDSAISCSSASSSSIYEQESWVVKLPGVLFICLNRYKFVQATQSSSKILEPFEFYPHIYLDR